MDGGSFISSRIFVYHSENENEIVTSVFKTMEKIILLYHDYGLIWLFGFSFNS